MIRNPQYQCIANTQLVCIHSMQHQEHLTLIYNNHNWAANIKPILTKIAEGKFSVVELISDLVLLSFHSKVHHEAQGNQADTYNYQYSFLKASPLELVTSLFSQMARLVLEGEQVGYKLPMLYAGTGKESTFTKQDALLLMSMMALNVVSSQAARAVKKFPMLYDFRWIFSKEQFKTQALLEYFRLQFDRLNKNPRLLDSKLTLRRIVQNRGLDIIIQQNKGRIMSPYHIGTNEQSIEDHYGDVKADFANKFIGGGALGGGCVQEELMFVNHPEMYTSVLFCEVMKSNEAIEFIGFEKYLKNTGYAFNAAFDGHQTHQYEYDEQNRAKQYIVAIDALRYQTKRSDPEFDMRQIDREILKAYTGFSQSGTPNNRVVTGNWGCGAFKGDLQLKFLIQWLACSLAGREMVYLPFGAKEKLKRDQVLNKLKGMTVEKVYDLIRENNMIIKQNKRLYEFLQSAL